MNEIKLIDKNIEMKMVYITYFLCSEASASLCTQENLHKSFTGQGSLEESFYSKTVRLKDFLLTFAILRGSAVMSSKPMQIFFKCQYQ